MSREQHTTSQEASRQSNQTGGIEWTDNKETIKAKTAIIHTLISSPGYEEHKGAQIKLEISHSQSHGGLSN